MSSTETKGTEKTKKTMPSSVFDHDDIDDDANENISRTSDIKPRRHSTRSNNKNKIICMGTSISSPTPSYRTTKSLSNTSTHFEINCSPIPIVDTEKSYYEQTRMRKQQQQQQQQEPSEQETHTQLDMVALEQGPPQTSQIVPPANGNDQVLNYLQRASNHSPKQWYQAPPSIPPFSEQGEYTSKGMSAHGDDDDDDDVSCFTVADSTLSFEHGTNMDINSASNVTSTSFTSGPSIATFISRGERLKKYGLVNIHKLKRKQQQRQIRRCSSKQSIIQNNQNINIHSQHSCEESSISDIPTEIRTAPLHVQVAVEEIHRWLFTEGGHFEDVQTLMTQYSQYIREQFGIPLDRMLCGGIGLHPKLTAYIWKWEVHEEFSFKEIPTHIFEKRNEIFGADEPFCVLEQGRADHIRIKDTDSYIPPDTAKWFRGGNYKDYFALPDIHKGFSKGGLTWSTKCPDGFCDDDIQFFRMTHAALTTVMRLHTNDLVVNTLTDRMEREIQDRTNELNIANRNMEDRTSELIIANQKLEEANEEISKHASKQLEHFACMSHEIRTPLNCIVGLSSLLMEADDTNEELLDNINMINNSADLVQGVVNDVLDYAKIESGHFELDVRTSDLQSTLNGVVRSISNKLQDKNVEVRTSYCGMLGKMMTTDSRRLQQILYNILGNAAKFSREGTSIDFKVRVMARTDGDDTIKGNSPHKIRFSIKDYGKGIEEKNYEKIFQPFSQASKETQTIYGGTGLGLSITKNLVTRLGGNISIRSEIDKFTEFIVDLPYDEEVVDAAKYKERMSETSVVILDLTERPVNSPPLEDDDFIPFPTEVIRHYGLNVMRCSSWGELESQLRLRANIRENYVFIAHEERQGILNVEKLVSQERCTWFTFGSDSSLHQQRQHHFKTLTGIFPSILVDKISEAIIAQREMGTSSNSSICSNFEMKSSSSMFLGFEPSSLIMEEKELLYLQETTEEAATRHPSLGSLLAVKTKTSKNKFATKYPPRALKILIVDDNTINQKILDRILKRLGVTDITIANNGKEAVDLAGTNQFDCIFMEMEMPVMGGLEACKRIVARGKDSTVRVAFVTAHDIEDIREKADAAGAFGYISKPLKMKDIREFLETLANFKPVKTNSVKSKSKRGAIYPPRNIKVLVAEDNLVNQKVLDRILKRLGVTDITIVDNGKKAVEISAITKFDCVLMDMQMPIMCGLEACKIIVERDKALSLEDGPKIIFVTAHALVEFQEKALAAGAFDFITKPFKMEDIDNLLKLLEGTSILSEAAPSLSDSGSPTKKVANTCTAAPIGRTPGGRRIVSASSA